jgi:hypothetical protein
LSSMVAAPPAPHPQRHRPPHVMLTAACLPSRHSRGLLSRDAAAGARCRSSDEGALWGQRNPRDAIAHPPRCESTSCNRS